MNTERCLNNLLNSVNYTNAQNFTLFVLTHHFANVCSRDLEAMENAFKVTNNIAANELLVRFSYAIAAAVNDPNNMPNLSDMMIDQLDPKTAVIEGGLECFAKVALATGVNLFKLKMPNPFIIYEEKLKINTIIKLITKCSKELVSPPITILILKDDNFTRAKNYLDLCPNNTVIKLIRGYDDNNNELYSVYNSGAKTFNDFFDFFGGHCFGTCSNTPNGIITDTDAFDNTGISLYVPLLLKYKSSLVIDEKDRIKSDINRTICELNDINTKDNNATDEYITLECLARSFRMLCYDSGDKDIKRTTELAKEVKTPLVRANVLKFSHFMPIKRTEKQELLKIASDIFESSGIKDQSIYCLNNSYLHEFSLKEHSAVSSKFKDLVLTAECDAIGMAGMPHLINNLGVAYIFENNLDKAIDTFTDGLEYVNNGKHHIQYFAILSNLFIAKYLNGIKIEDNEIIKFIGNIFRKMITAKVDYLTGHYVLNVLAVCVSFNSRLYKELVNRYPIYTLIERALTNNMGTGSMIYQMNVLSSKYSSFDILTHIDLPVRLTEFIGERKNFTEHTGFNPFIFNIWL